MVEQIAGSPVKRPGTKRAAGTRRIEVVNRKGGAGKTTTSLNVAEWLGQMQYRVLLVDFDANASATKALGVNKGSGVTVSDLLLLDGTDIIQTAQAIIQPETVHFDLLIGNNQLNGAALTLAAQRRQDALHKRLQEIESDYDFVIIDTSADEGFLHSMGHLYAKEVIIPVEADLMAWDAFQETMRSLRTVREGGLNPDLRVRTVLVTQYQAQKTNFGDSFMKLMRDQLGDLLFDQVVLYSVRHKEAIGRNRPIVADLPNSQGAAVYRKLAEFIAHE